MVEDKLGLSDAIIEKTAYIYRKAQEKGLVRGRSTSATLAASVYVSCREAGIPKTLKEIAEANNTRRKTTAKTCRILLTELDIKIPTFDLIKYILKLANKANLNEGTKRHAIGVMNNVTKKAYLENIIMIYAYGGFIASGFQKIEVYTLDKFTKWIIQKGKKNLLLQCLESLE